jgi:hypothetical protein
MRDLSRREFIAAAIAVAEAIPPDSSLTKFW